MSFIDLSIPDLEERAFAQYPRPLKPTPRPVAPPTPAKKWGLDDLLVTEVLLLIILTGFVARGVVEAYTALHGLLG